MEIRKYLEYMKQKYYNQEVFNANKATTSEKFHPQILLLGEMEGQQLISLKVKKNEIKNKKWE